MKYIKQYMLDELKTLTVKELPKIFEVQNGCVIFYKDFLTVAKSNQKGIWVKHLQNWRNMSLTEINTRLNFTSWV